MRSYTAKDIEGYFRQYAAHISHVAVAHTHFRPFGKSPRQIEMMTAQASRSCRHSLNWFAKFMHPRSPNNVVRKPLRFRPLTFVTIEAANVTDDKALTIHFNFCFGNLPKVLTTEQIETVFTYGWHRIGKQSSDVKLYEVKHNERATEKWCGYSVKEAQQDRRKAWKIEGIWDVTNCWVPHEALTAD